MTWLIPLACALAGLAVLAWCALQLQREIGPTTRSFRLFGEELRPVLLRTRDAARRARDRSSD